MRTACTTLALGVLIFSAATVSLAVTSEPNPPAGAPSTSAPPPGNQTQIGSNLVSGEVLNIEKDRYVVRGADGKEITLKIDGGTRIVGTPRVGDRIEAEVSSDHRAANIHPAPR